MDPPKVRSTRRGKTDCPSVKEEEAVFRRGEGKARPWRRKSGWVDNIKKLTVMAKAKTHKRMPTVLWGSWQYSSWSNDVASFILQKQPSESTLLSNILNKCNFMYTWGPSHFLFQQYLKNVILCKDRSIGIQKKKKKKKKNLLTEQNNQNIVNCDSHVLTFLIFWYVTNT